MITVDASVLIGHLDGTDAHHLAATRWLLSAPRPLIAHPITLAEVLIGGVRSGRLIELETILRDLGVESAAGDDDEAHRLASLRVATGLKLPDCCVISTAQLYATAIATFDASLAAAAERIGLSVVPGNTS